MVGSKETSVASLWCILSLTLVACSSGGGGAGAPTGGGGDGAPKISGVLVTGLGGTEAWVTWQTDRPATSRVEYGPTPEYGQLQDGGAALVTSHSVMLAGLGQGVTYQYRVVSVGATGKEAQTPNAVFENTSADGRQVTGTLRAWHPIQLSFRGPHSSELDDLPNPFLDYRLAIVFTGPSGQELTVPGFFDGDGEGSGTGDIWRVRFALDQGGTWSYVAHFDQGDNLAVDLDLSHGTPTAFQESAGTIPIADRDADAKGFYSWGLLEYVGGHYLKFRDGPYFLKGGTDSPENLLGYAGFDNTIDQAGGTRTSGLEGGVHRYGGHVADFGAGGLGDDDDPVFASQDTGYGSEGLVGALNYLASKGVNSVYFLPMNLGGDGRETYPFVTAAGSEFDKKHYDVSKLYQWNRIFEHAQRRGILLHFVLSETEPDNESYFDGGQLGVERKLFYRELVARFGHCLAIKWNLGEEADLPVADLQSFADYIREVDPYDHPVAFHTHALPSDGSYALYETTLGDDRFSMSSIQASPDDMGAIVESWRAASAAAGHPWVIDCDEQLEGLTDTNAHALRRRQLYDVYFSGGNVEWYFGYHDLPLGGDVRTEDFRTRAKMWGFMAHARRFMEQNLPFWEMEPADELLSGESPVLGGGEVFAKAGEVYAVYLPSTEQTGNLDLGAAGGTFTQRWFDPRNGLFAGAPLQVAGGSSLPLGTPPDAGPGTDWVVLLTR